MATKKKKVKRKDGRRPLILKLDWDKIKKLAELGASEKQICEHMGINFITLKRAQKKYPEFSSFVKVNKERSDDEMVASLRKRAKGFVKKNCEKIFYNAKQDKVVRVRHDKYFPPDTVAILSWLHNRRNEVWKRNPDLKQENKEIPFISNIKKQKGEK